MCVCVYVKIFFINIQFVYYIGYCSSQKSVIVLSSCVIAYVFFSPNVISF